MHHGIAFHGTVALLFTLAATSLEAQELAVAASPPADTEVHSFTPADMPEAVCAGASEWSLEVPTGAWIQFSRLWFATDEATARQNWEHMRIELWVDDQQLPLPEDTDWSAGLVHFDCPSGALDGFAMSPVFYLPPVTAQRKVRLRYLFDEDVDDGWNTFGKGTDISGTLTLKPRN